jgi:hypothetical protein
MLLTGLLPRALPEGLDARLDQRKPSIAAPTRRKFHVFRCQCSECLWTTERI